MIKKVLQILLPLSLYVLWSGFTYETYKLESTQSVVDFKVTAKYASASIGKHNISEHYMFDLCPVSTEQKCIRKNVRQDVWGTSNVGDKLSFKTSDMEFESVNRSNFGFISMVFWFTTHFLILVYVLSYLIYLLYKREVTE